MKYPLVSIVMISFKGGKFVLDGIRSILKQTYKNIELIIVLVKNDYETISIVEGIRDKRIKIIFSNYARVSHQRNLGAFESQGRYMMFFDSDDFLYPYSIKKLVDYAERKSAVIVYPTFRISDENLKTKMRFIAPKFDYQDLLKSCFITDVSFTKRKELLKYLPLKFSDGTYSIYNVWKKMGANKKYKGKILPFKQATFIYRQHKDCDHKNEDKRENNFKCVTVGENKNLLCFQNGVKKVKAKDLLSFAEYCVYFTDPLEYLNNRNQFAYKRIIIHWDDNNIGEINNFPKDDCLHHIAMNRKNFSILEEKKIGISLFFTDKDSIKNYLDQEKY